jgi:predicted RNA-binding Zn-ribbon protein involved in translation (DUF1610 family)
LSVHASDLAIKEAFEAEVKYWAAIAADIRPRIESRAWTNEQKHKDRFDFKASAAGVRREQINSAYTSQTCPQCGYLDKANRKADVFQCLKCGH